MPRPPTRDLYELARSLLLKSPDPISRDNYDTPTDLEEGHRDTFNVLDLVDLVRYKDGATLKLVSEHAYWYVEDGLSVSRGELEDAAQAFEGRIFPRVTQVFGPLWPPEAPKGQRITILHARLRGVGGYYSSVDEYPSQVHEYSNQRKMIYINASFMRVGSPEYLDTLAHELQHAVHWNRNPAQSTWLNEGLSQVASRLVGYQPGTVGLFTPAPTISLVYWPLDILSSGAYYGAAFLFSQYLSNHYGAPEDLHLLLEAPEVGVEGMDHYLAVLGDQGGFQDLFGRWIVANYLDEANGGPYSYPDLRVSITPTDVLEEPGTRSLSQPQYSARYVLLDLKASQARVHFSGGIEVPLLPVDPLEGGYCWWSNRGDSISSSLTEEFDLTEVEQATLQFRVWYEIEAGWDYGYVQVSTDAGSTWDILEGGKATPGNPVGNSYGSGYSGLSGGWVEDQVDLTPYVGSGVLVRFHYVTDDAINGTGLCLDTISIPEIGFYDDASQNLGWEAEGFFRTNNRVPQGYVVQIIEISDDGNNVVRRMDLDKANQGQILLQNLDTLDRVVLVVGSLAGGSSQPAWYELMLEPVE